MRNGLHIHSNGTKMWYKNDLLHREDGPAIEYMDGTKHWCKDGKYHRNNGPAIEYSSGTKEWHQDGLLISVQYSNGLQFWIHKQNWFDSFEAYALAKVMG